MTEAEYLKSEEGNIRQIVRKRIVEINALVGGGRAGANDGKQPTHLQILDLGSNWGFYLSEYRKIGWQAIGVERETCYPQQPTDWRCDVKDFPYGSFKFDVISAFCILEHLSWPEISALLPKIAGALNPGGLFVVKAPYCNGWTGRFAPHKYYLDQNHQVELGKTGLFKTFVELEGLKLVKTVIEGIHPERVFPRFGKTKLAGWLTEKLGMGDARVWYFRK